MSYLTYPWMEDHWIGKMKGLDELTTTFSPASFSPPQGCAISGEVWTQMAMLPIMWRRSSWSTSIVTHCPSCRPGGPSPYSGVSQGTATTHGLAWRKVSAHSLQLTKGFPAVWFIWNPKCSVMYCPKCSRWKGNHSVLWCSLWTAAQHLQEAGKMCEIWSCKYNMFRASVRFILVGSSEGSVECIQWVRYINMLDIIVSQPYTIEERNIVNNHDDGKAVPESCLVYQFIWSLVALQVILNLVDQSGREKMIGDTYLKQVLLYNNPNLTYVSFDFHEHWWVSPRETNAVFDVCCGSLNHCGPYGGLHPI